MTRTRNHPNRAVWIGITGDSLPQGGWLTIATRHRSQYRCRLWTPRDGHQTVYLPRTAGRAVVARLRAARIAAARHQYDQTGGLPPALVAWDMARGIVADRIGRRRYVTTR